jgi:hypothetical protein
MVSNSGALRVVFDFGFERQDEVYDADSNKNFGTGQYHDVRVTRKNFGKTLVIQVDNYKPKELILLVYLFYIMFRSSMKKTSRQKISFCYCYGGTNEIRFN